MNRIKYYLLIAVALFSVACFLESCSNKNNEFRPVDEYDIIQINGEGVACFGYKSMITYPSDWDLRAHKGVVLLPCGDLKAAQKGEYNYDDLYTIDLDGHGEDLKIGSKLELLSPKFRKLGSWETLNYVSGMAVVTDKKADEYVIIDFKSFKCEGESGSYVVHGTVQLMLDEER